MIGGAGEKKTLKLVARYAQACNIFGTTDVAHKLEVLRAHCETEGRSYDEIEKGVITRFDVGEKGERAGELVEELERYAASRGSGRFWHSRHVSPTSRLSR